MSIGARIRKLRQQKGYSQEYVATQLGLSQNGFCRIENDEVKIKVETLLQLSHLLEADVNQVLYSSCPDVRQAHPANPERTPHQPGRSAGSHPERDLYEDLLRSKNEQLLLQQQLLASQSAEILQLKNALMAQNTQENAPNPAPMCSCRQENPPGCSPGQAMELQYRDHYIDIWYDSAHGWLYANWKSIQRVESIRHGCEHMLHLLQANGCRKVLNDNRLVEGGWMFSADWVARHWLPEAATGGMQYFAWVCSPDHFSQASIDKVVASHTARATVKTFRPAREAYHWLQSS